MTTPTQAEELKQIVKEKYGQIAEQGTETAGGCCGPACGCGILDNTLMAEDYTKMQGYVADADLGLGCGLPTEYAHIKEGDVVVDLGSGAGNDAFVARSITGANGKVIGVDFTEQMIAKARSNAEKLGFNNVEFRFGDIENIPINNDVADVVVSNCVLNLVPDKARAFQETYRILKPGGHFSVSDIVLRGDLPPALQKSAEMYAGCVSGAIDKFEYLNTVKKSGFQNIEVQKERRITLPNEVLSLYLNAEELERYRTGEIGIFSITVYAEKPLVKKGEACAPGCCGN
ncbi:MAG TPA: arsenite methyltransferase [Chryseosolibacter sp.]